MSVSVQQILKQVGLSQYENKIVKKFSLGMKQRLAIGVALLGNPDFLILDEPINERIFGRYRSFCKLLGFFF